MDNPAVKTTTNIRVLHVDDEPMICDVTRLCLERNGRFIVDAVHTAEEALSLLRKSPYACVISDYEMPSMNGIELLREIRTFDQEIPFILFSGRGRETVIIDAINTGADFYIQKGGDAKSLFAELNHKVDYAINKRNARLALKRRDAILEAVSLVATLFLGGEPFKKAIAESVTLFGLATEVDRVKVYRLSEENEENSSFHCLCSWNRPDVILGNNSEDVLHANSFSFIEKILDGEVVIGTSGMFDDATKKLLEEQQIKSIAVFPVIAEQKIRGMVMFCDCLSEREWAMVEVDALQAASSIIGSAIFQDEMRTDLITTKEQYESMYSMMRQLCDTVPDMLWAKDLSEKFIFVNRETATCLLGVSDTDEPVGKKESEYLNLKRASPEVQDTDDSYPSTGLQSPVNPQTGIIQRIITDNGKKIELEIRSVPFYNISGELIGTVAVGRDVTESRNADLRVQEEQRRYSRIFHNVHLGLISCTVEGIISDINNRAADLLGFNRDYGMGLNLYTMHGFGKTCFIQDYTSAIVQKRSIHGKGHFSDMQGNSRILYYAISPHLDDNGRIIDLMLTIDEHYQD